MSFVDFQNARTATIISDASFCNQTKSAGWASWIAVDGERFRFYGNFQRPIMTSVDAEMGAIVSGVCAFVELYETFTKDIRQHTVLVQSDCVAALDALFRKPITNISKQAFVYDMRQILQEQRKKFGLFIQPRHVKGHQSNNRGARYYVNNQVDKYARIVMEEQRRSHYAKNR